MVWPDISSPAQSFASVTHPISVSGPLGTPVPGFSKWAVPGFAAVLFWQHSQANILHVNTSRRPTKKVMRLEHKKAYQCLSWRHISAALGVELAPADIFRPTLDHFIPLLPHVFKINARHFHTQHLYIPPWLVLSIHVCIAAMGFLSLLNYSLMLMYSTGCKQCHLVVCSCSHAVFWR